MTKPRPWNSLFGMYSMADGDSKMFKVARKRLLTAPSE